mmetsp:Transcript_67733/g.141575  ORF Transcript_67733/g.141575 Transcript_67733/m.141575 type:complete len:190 (-) Transcript_67733:962-1531(-)
MELLATTTTTIALRAVDDSDVDLDSRPAAIVVAVDAEVKVEGGAEGPRRETRLRPRTRDWRLLLLSVLLMVVGEGLVVEAAASRASPASLLPDDPFDDSDAEAHVVQVSLLQSSLHLAHEGGHRKRAEGSSSTSSSTSSSSSSNRSAQAIRIIWPMQPLLLPRRPQPGWTNGVSQVQRTAELPELYPIH